MRTAEIEKKGIDELITGLIAGNDASWRNFLRSAGPVIRCVCRRAGLSDDEIEDVTQSFVLKLLERNCRALRSLRIEGDTKFYSWVKVVVSRTVVDFMRRSDRRRDHETQWGGKHWADFLWSSASDGIEMKVMLDNMVSRLTPSEQTLFWLDYSDLSDKEIAEVLGIKLTTAQQRLSRLRKRMKEILTGEKVTEVT